MILRWFKSKVKRADSIEIKDSVNGNYFLTLQKFIPRRNAISGCGQTQFIKSHWIDVPMKED